MKPEVLSQKQIPQQTLTDPTESIGIEIRRVKPSVEVVADTDNIQGSEMEDDEAIFM